MDDFYAARDNTMPPLPWTNFAPPHTVTSTHAQTSEDVFLDDCPRGGCLSFSFTLPSDWESKTYAEKGQTLALPYPDAAPWNGTVVSSDKDNCPVPVAEFN